MKAYATRHTGFTLTELLVAIGLIVVLMLAVSVIFSSASGTIGSGQALSSAMRDLRSVETIIKKDLDSAAISDGPFFMIRSNVQVAFPNQKDRLGTPGYTATGTIADVDPMLTADLGNGAGPQQQPVTSYGIRTFRQDMLSFFTRGLFQRQTGNDGTFAAPLTSNEAFVWYGHLMLPDNAAAPNPRWPGLWDGITYWTAATNPNNFYASQWTLGRVAMLLLNPISGTINDNYGTAQMYYAGRNLTAADIPPLADNPAGTIKTTATQDGVTPSSFRIFDSRFDLAGTAISSYRYALVAAIPNIAPPNYWWDNLHFGYRFQANPFPVRPLTSASAAGTVPMFVPRCSQFIVEFAGDFTTQDATGALAAANGDQPDGIIDYVVDAAGIRRARWYGMPRDVLGTGVIRGITAAVRGNDMLNVVPLSDVLASGGYPAAPFEHYNFVPQNNYAFWDYTQAAPNGGLRPDAQYVCAWGPDLAPTVPKPRMLRILIKPEDPTGKIDLPWQEMIFNLP